jgi:hypothetical protein
MIRSALFLCAGIIITACFGCAPAAQTPPPPPPPPVAATPTSCIATFLGNVQILTAPFSPNPRLAAPQGTPITPKSPYWAGLNSAFTAASDAFQLQLCKLDRIYVNEAVCSNPDACPTPGDSWGWSQSTPTLGKGRIVALSSGLWSYAAHKSPYADYETDVMQTVMPLSGAYYSNANVDNFSMVLLSALAHEMGHILWYEAVTPYPHGSGKYLAPADFCGGKFFQTSWSLVTAPPRWRVLLTPTQRNHLWGKNNWPNMHKYSPHVRDIDNSGNLPYKEAQILGLFAAVEPWASAFATVSPDEDFVETYRFKVLTSELKLPVTSVTITVPTSQYASSEANVARDYSQNLKTDLTTKVGCVPDLQ